MALIAISLLAFVFVGGALLSMQLERPEPGYHDADEADDPPGRRATR